MLFLVSFRSINSVSQEGPTLQCAALVQTLENQLSGEDEADELR